MIPALLFATGSALLGGALALVARGNKALLERTRTFAFAAAASVVGFHLLPEVLPPLGARALVWVSLGFGLPWLLEAVARKLGPRLGRAAGGSGLRVAAEVGFFALVFHSLVEGVTLWAALQAPGSHLDLEIAIVAHHATLTAAVALPFLELGGPRAAVIRVLGIGLAGATGVFLGAALPALSASSLEEVLLPATAATAGALLHVAFDEIGQQRFGAGRERAWDLTACFAGFAVAALGALQKGGEAPLAQGFLRSLTALAILAAPALVAGAVASAVLGRKQTLGFLRRLLGALPIDAAALTLLLFGPAGLLVRAAAALISAALSRSVPEAAARDSSAPAPPDHEGAPQRRLTDDPTAGATVLTDASRRGPWLLVGLLLAAAVHVLAGPAALAPLPISIAAAFALLLCCALIPESAGTTAATIVAGVLALKGAPAPLLLAALAVGSAVDRAALKIPRMALISIGLSPLVMTAAVVLHVRSTAPAEVRLPIADASAQLIFGARPAAGVLLAAWLGLLLVAVFRLGIRGFLAPLRHGGHAR